MLEDNEDLMASFKKYLDNPEENITFIKELMRERRKVRIIISLCFKIIIRNNISNKNTI